MNKKLIAVGVLAAFAFGAMAQTTRKSGIIYVPKKVGQTKQRTDGATRTGGEPRVKVRVITPLETALLASDSSPLLWFIDQPTTFPIRVVIKDRDDEPLYKQTIERVEKAGVMPIDLSKATTPLSPDTDYRLMILVKVNPEDPASDIESSGTIRIEAPSPELKQQLAAATGVNKAIIYAENGYFVDAVTTLKADPSPEAKEALDGLLDQVGLKLETK